MHFKEFLDNSLSKITMSFAFAGGADVRSGALAGSLNQTGAHDNEYYRKVQIQNLM